MIAKWKSPSETRGGLSLKLSPCIGGIESSEPRIDGQALIEIVHITFMDVALRFECGHLSFISLGKSQVK